MKIDCVIPARYGSSRFPGKPLADICGKPMIWWVYQTASRINGIHSTYVATDDQRIIDACSNLGMNAILTSEDHRTGVDRLTEVAKSIDSDFYILVQGDEPLIENNTLETLVQKVASGTVANSEVATFKTPVCSPIDIVNNTIIKIVTDLNDNVLLASRSPIPYPKESIAFTYYKSVGVYAYSREILNIFPSLRTGYLESVEEHDFMRLLENGIRIKAFTLKTDTLSVDTYKDLERVRLILANANYNLR